MMLESSSMVLSAPSPYHTDTWYSYSIIIHVITEFLSTSFIKLSDGLVSTYLCCGTSHRVVRRRPSARWSGRHAWCCRGVCRWVAGVGRGDTARRWHSAVGRTPTPGRARSRSPAPPRCRGRRAADGTAPATFAPTCVPQHITLRIAHIINQTPPLLG